MKEHYWPKKETPVGYRQSQSIPARTIREIYRSLPSV